VEGDARGFRVALVAGELLNNQTGVDVLSVLAAEDWGAIQLPASDYPDEVAGPLLEQVAEQSEEFFRHGYRLAIVGGRAGLAEALAAYRLPELPQIDPAIEDDLRTFLVGLPAPTPTSA
jgi:hypothetical protein